MRWFRRLGWIYRPVALPGWLLTGLALAACVAVGAAVDRHSHSVSDTLIGTFPYAAIFVIVLGWIASHTSGGDDV